MHGDRKTTLAKYAPRVSARLLSLDRLVAPPLPTAGYCSLLLGLPTPANARAPGSRLTHLGRMFWVNFVVVSAA